MSNIGILGGTFDPPHIGHVIIAKEVQLACGLDEIWFVPTNEPPHKSQAIADPTERVSMLKQLLIDEPSWRVHDIELQRTGKSYTIDTILTLQEMYPNDTFHFIIGGDMVEYLPHWHQIDQLRTLVSFISVNRPGYTDESPYTLTEVTAPVMDVSSTMIRERLSKGRSPHYLLPKTVYTYIKEHQLYGYKANNE